MKKTLLWLGAGVGVAVVGLLAASAWSSLSVLGGLAGPSAPPPPPPDPILQRAAQVERPAPAPPVASAPALAPAASPAAPLARSQLVPPPDLEAWSATPLTQRPSSIGRAGVDLEKGLGALHAELAPCFTPQGQASYEGRPALGVENQEADDPGSPVVTLQVEAYQGYLRVAGAPVQVRSGASDATLACLQARLLNVQIKTDATPKAQRFRMRYMINP
jgi:hypothetical protein